MVYSNTMDDKLALKCFGKGEQRGQILFSD